MAGSESFLFEKPVGVLEEMCNPTPCMGAPVKAKIQMVQNGYELNYEGKEFIAKNLDEGLEMIRSWMEMNEKEMAKKNKA